MCSNPDTTTARGRAEIALPDLCIRSLSATLFCARRLSGDVAPAGIDSSASAMSSAPRGENKDESGSGSVLKRWDPGRPLDALDRMVEPGVRFARRGRREEARDDPSKSLSSSSPSVLSAGNEAERWGAWRTLRGDLAVLASGIGPERGVPSTPPREWGRGVLLRCEENEVCGVLRKKSDLRNLSGRSSCPPILGKGGCLGPGRSRLLDGF